MSPTMQKHWHNEQGTVLVVGMLTLVLLTLIGIAATTTGSLESEISGNEKSYQQAFYASEIALVSGEIIVEGLATRAALAEGTTPGRYPQGSLSFDHTTFKLIQSQDGMGDAIIPRPLRWDNTDSAAVTNVPTGLSWVAAPPRYTIEEREFQPDSQGIGITYGRTGTYRFTVSGRGTGGSKSAQLLLETIYAKRFN